MLELLKDTLYKYHMCSLALFGVILAEWDFIFTWYFDTLWHRIIELFHGPVDHQYVSVCFQFYRKEFVKISKYLLHKESHQRIR